MYKNVKGKMYFMLHLMIHLTVQSKGWPEGTLEGASNDALSDLHKDAQEGAFVIARGCTWVAPMVVLVDAIINLQICTKWFNGGPNAALEGALDGAFNVALDSSEGAPTFDV